MEYVGLDLELVVDFKKNYDYNDNAAHNEHDVADIWNILVAKQN